MTDLARVTRTRVQAWIEGGRVAINGRVVQRVSTRAALGDVVVVQLPDETPRLPVLPEDGPLDCLFEDEQLLVVNKPPGIVSHPTYRHPSGSLLNLLLGHARDWSDGQRPSLVGRLDKHTSGIVVVAKTAEAHARLQRTLASSHSEKSYLAAVYGPVNRGRGEIALSLGRDPHDRRRIVATKGEGLRSLTRFERLDEADADGCSIALLRCSLVTGRTHQIRVHLSASGWPIVGDPAYGEARWRVGRAGHAQDALQAFARQALHAWRVSFVHPFTEKPVEVQAGVPADMLELLGTCGLREPR